MKRQTLTVNQYEQMQEQFNFQDQQYGSVNCYHSPFITTILYTLIHYLMRLKSNEQT